MAKGLHLMSLVAGAVVVLLCCIAVAGLVGWVPLPALFKGGAAPINFNTASAPAPCGRCARVEGVREIGTVRGVSGRIVSGAALAQQLGGFSSITNVLGLVLVAMAGRPDEPDTGTATVYETTVRYEDGSTRVLTEINPPQRRSGDLVKIVGGRIQPAVDVAPHSVANARP